MASKALCNVTFHLWPSSEWRGPNMINVSTAGAMCPHCTQLLISPKAIKSHKFTNHKFISSLTHVLEPDHSHLSAFSFGWWKQCNKANISQVKFRVASSYLTNSIWEDVNDLLVRGCYNTLPIYFNNPMAHSYSSSLCNPSSHKATDLEQQNIRRWWQMSQLERDQTTTSLTHAWKSLMMQYDRILCMSEIHISNPVLQKILLLSCSILNGGNLPSRGVTLVQKFIRRGTII